MRLPPLNALRAFEAAARLEGFVPAAEELHVTPAAVSHHIKTLESYLDVALFRRLPRKGVELTSAGRELLPEVTMGLAHFARGVGGLAGGGLTGRLSISALPSFATLWLVPRLDGFLRAFPEVEVRLVATTNAPDLRLDEFDLRIEYGRGEYPGLQSKLLLRDTVFPVCAPTLLNRTPLRRFSDLRNHTLLHDIDISPDEPTMIWKRWLRDTGVDANLPLRNVEFGDSMLLTEAVVRGQGVALGRMSLVRDHLMTGRLLRPLKASRPGDYAYYTVTTTAGAERPRVQAFLRWLEEEVEGDALEIDAL